MRDPRSPELGHRSVSVDEPVHRLNSEHQSDLVGIKDNITVAPTDERSHGISDAVNGTDTLVRLAIKCPSLADTSMGESTIVTVPSHYTIAHVKRQIERMWPGKPKAEGMRFFKSGQALNDDTIVSILARSTDADDTPVIHLVIRPGAWTSSPRRAARSTPGSDINVARSVSSSSRQRSASSRQARPPQPSMPYFEIPRFSKRSVSATEQDRHVASIVEKMDPAHYQTFRSLLSWAYARYVDAYTAEWTRSYSSLVDDSYRAEQGTSASSLEQLAREMAWSVGGIEAAIDSVESNVLLWGPLEDEVKSDQANAGAFNYKQCIFQGLPYLLRVERNPAEEKLRALQGRIDRLRNLVLQMEKLINYQTLLTRTTPTSSRLASLGGEAMMRTPGVAVPRRPAPRETPFQRFSLLDRSDVTKVLLASFFLTFKMAILLYVFTRGVSRAKMAMMGGVSLLYILYEAWTMLERRVRARRRDLRRANGEDDQTARRGPAAGGAQDDGDGPASNAMRRESSTRDGDGGDTATGSTSIRSPRSPNRYRVFSPFLLAFWIERAAYFNLAEEDREIGMRPPEGPRALATTARSPSAIVRSIKDFVVLPVFLFVVTLVPAVEQRRRRAIEQRDDMIRSTAAKVEEQKRRLREALEKRQAEETLGKTEAGSANNEAASASSSSSIRPPTVLRSRYGQQVLQRGSTGRQIDIAQEIEAAAAAAADEEANNLEQADMGFL